MGNTQCCSADGGTAPPVDAEGEPLFEHTQDKAMTKAMGTATANAAAKTEEDAGASSPAANDEEPLELFETPRTTPPPHPSQQSSTAAQAAGEAAGVTAAKDEI